MTYDSEFHELQSIYNLTHVKSKQKSYHNDYQEKMLHQPAKKENVQFTQHIVKLNKIKKTETNICKECGIEDLGN